MSEADFEVEVKIRWNYLSGGTELIVCCRNNSTKEVPGGGMPAVSA